MKVMQRGEDLEGRDGMIAREDWFSSAMPDKEHWRLSRPIWETWAGHTGMASHQI